MTIRQSLPCLRRGAFILLLWLIGPAQAADLYATQVGIAGQGAQARQTAIRSALSQILLRLGGTPAETLGASVERPERYVLSYQYVRDVRDPKGGLRLQVSFDERAVGQLLRQHKLTIWTGARPVTLIWLGIDDQGQRRVLQNPDDPAAQALLQAGQRYALPLIWSTAGNAPLDYLDVTAVDETRLQAAVQANHADAVLLVNLYPHGNQWEARWMLFSEGQRTPWQTGPDVLDAVMDLGMRQLDTAYVTSYGLPSDDTAVQQLRIEVEGITSLTEQAQAQAALAALEQIRGLQLVQVEGDRLRLTGEAVGSPERLRRNLARSATLQTVEAPAIEEGMGVIVLRLRLRGQS